MTVLKSENNVLKRHIKELKSKSFNLCDKDKQELAELGDSLSESDDSIEASTTLQLNNNYFYSYSKAVFFNLIHRIDYKI